MQSHRHPRNDTGGQYGAMSRRPIPPDRLCRVIAFGTEPSCDRAGFRTHPRQLCKQHRSEHKALYLAYKNSSAEVDRLLALVDDEPNWEDPTCLTLTALGSAITNRQQFMDAIQEEIRGRIKHQARFIADPDDGHVKWLQLRRNMHEECSQVLEQLKRRQEILKADEARKQEAAQAHVERQRQAAEAEASAIRRQHEMRRLAEERRQREAREEERRRRQEQEQRQECARRMQEAQAEAVARKLADLQHQHQTMFAGAGAIQGVREVQGSHPATSQIPSQQPEHRSLAGHAVRPASFAQGLACNHNLPRFHNPARATSTRLVDDREGQREVKDDMVEELPGLVEVGAFMLMTVVTFIVLLYWVR